MEKLAKTSKVNKSIILQSLQKQAKQPLLELRKVQAVKNQQELEHATSQLSYLKAVLKAAEEKEDAIVNPILQGVKELKEFFKPFKQEIISEEVRIKKLVQEYILKIEEEQEKLEDVSDSISIKKFLKKQEQLANAAQATKLSVRNTSALKIVDVKKIPREYLVPDEAKITATLKSGEEVPGCTLEKVNQIAIR